MGMESAEDAEEDTEDVGSDEDKDEDDADLDEEDKDEDDEDDGEYKRGVLEELDTNKDGKLSLAELTAHEDAETVSLFEAGFKKADADGDGFLAREELSSFRQEV